MEKLDKCTQLWQNLMTPSDEIDDSIELLPSMEMLALGMLPDLKSNLKRVVDFSTSKWNVDGKWPNMNLVIQDVTDGNEATELNPKTTFDDYMTHRAHRHRAVTTKVLLLPDTRRFSFNNSIERNRITLKFNNILKEACNKNNIIYKDIFRHLINEKLETKSELYCDNIHLGIQSQPLLLEEFSDIIQNYAN